MKIQQDPFNGFQNHFENYMDFKRAVRERNKCNDPKLINKN